MAETTNPAVQGVTNTPRTPPLRTPPSRTQPGRTPPSQTRPSRTQPSRAALSPPPAPSRRSLGRSAITRRTSLAIHGIVPIETWRQIGEQLLLVSNSSAWWLGDWLLYGQDKYPERYRRAIAETALDYQTLRNYAWVARRFEPSRRREQLSFQHHMEVAALPPGEQDAALDRAQRFGWSRNQLRSHVRAGRKGAAGEAPIAVAVQLNISPDQRTRWERAAGQAERDLLEWIRRVLDEAAKRALEA